MVCKVPLEPVNSHCLRMACLVQRHDLLVRHNAGRVPFVRLRDLAAQVARVVQKMREVVVTRQNFDT